MSAIGLEDPLPRLGLPPSGAHEGPGWVAPIPSVWVLGAVSSAGVVVLAVAVAALGASVGSFLGVVFDRVPKGESIGGRSHCVCGAPILARDNLPIIGYLLRRGRSRCCGARIPIWYFWLEVAGALVALGLLWLVIG